MVKILVADAQYIVRMGMKQVCQDLAGFMVAGEATNGEQMLDALDTGEFDMLVLDPSISISKQGRKDDVGAVALLKTLRARHMNLPILAFSASNDPQMAKRVLSKGISGFVTKDSDQETLVTAMRRVAVGEHFVCHDIAVNMMFGKRVHRDAELQERLSPREWDVLTMFGQGMIVSDIADKLCINSRTVSTHKTRLMHKMNFKSNAELIHYAVEYLRSNCVTPERVNLAAPTLSESPRRLIDQPIK